MHQGQNHQAMPIFVKATQMSTILILDTKI